jgi:glycosyltransferase involved in cell wall biosynthesis
VRVAVDTSPLVQTAAGTARHLRGQLTELDGRQGIALERISFGGAGRVSTLARDGIWYPLALGRAARTADVLHCPTFRAPLRSKARLVVTVHDVALFRHPTAFPLWHRVTGRIALRAAVRSADAVVAVSEFTRAELQDVLDVPGERVRVVPNGVDAVFTPDGPAVDGDYVLAVGTLEPRKNLAVAVEAAALAGVELRVVGARGWGGVDAPGGVGRPGDPVLAALLRGARCLVVPSLYEGIGLPVLESMACGTPVVTARGGATEEVAGGAAVLVDAHDPAGVAAGIEEAQTRRSELVRVGLERASEFTWARSADRIEQLWRELV